MQDEYARDLVRNSWPWPRFYPDKIKVTGQPGLDYLNKINCQEARRSLQEKFSLREDRPIVYFSGFVEGMEEALEIVVQALNLLAKPVYFFLRHHPRILAGNSPETFRSIHLACDKILENLASGQVVKSYDLASTEEVLSGSDVVIGTPDSISLIEACYLHVPCVVLKTKLREEILFRNIGNLLRHFPPCTFGACLEAGNAFELKTLLDGVFSDGVPLLKNMQEHFFKNDGKAAQRVYQAIYSLF